VGRCSPICVSRAISASRAFSCAIRTAARINRLGPDHALLQLDGARLRFGDVEDVGDDLHQMPAGVQNVIGELFVLRLPDGPKVSLTIISENPITADNGVLSS